jgi:tetratricopeptide (TPR) repeat protein
LIVKNEERSLGVCLASLEEIVDELVVVDTGSTDGTKDIARRAGARVSDFRWTNDFSAARNHALDLVRSEWVLSIDADERVRPAAGAELRRQLGEPSFVGYYVSLYPRPGFTSQWVPRVFRNHPNIRFRSAFHEAIGPALQEYRAISGGQIGYSRLEIDHEGYEGDQHAKWVRNLPILRKAVRQEPERIYCWCHLAEVYAGLGKERAAEAAWNTALALVRRNTARTPDDGLPYIGLIPWQFARGRDVSALLEEAAQRCPRNIQLLWIRGRILMSGGRFEEAMSCFENLLEIGKIGVFDRTLGYDTRLFNVLAYDSLATCCFRTGRYSESRRYYELATQHDPERLEYRVKAQLCSRLARPSGETARA